MLDPLSPERYEALDTFLGIGIVVGLFLIAFYIFRGTMNLFQWFPFREGGPGSRHLYWLTANDASPASPWVHKSFLYRADPPWFSGTGVTVRIRRHSFTVGVGKELPEPEWFRELDVPVEVIRDGVDSDWEATTKAEDPAEEQKASGEAIHG